MSKTKHVKASAVAGGAVCAFQHPRADQGTVPKFHQSDPLGISLLTLSSSILRAVGFDRIEWSRIRHSALADALADKMRDKSTKPIEARLKPFRLLSAGDITQF